MLLKTKQIPPGLLKIATRNKGSKKYLFLIGLLAFTVAIGFSVVFLYNYYLIPEIKESNSIRQPIIFPQTLKSEPPKIEQPMHANTDGKTLNESSKIRDLETSQKIEVKPKEKSIKQAIAEEKTTKPAEIPLEKLNIETFKGADYLYRAQYFETAGNYSDAISEYKEYLKVTGKQDPKIFNKIATLYLLTGNLTEAAQYAEQSLKQAPDDHSVILNYGAIQAKMGNLSTAEECFRKVLSVNPENKTALYNLALLKEKRKEYEEALKLYERVYQLGDPQAAEAIQRVNSYK